MRPYLIIRDQMLMNPNINDPGKKQRAADKLARIPIKIEETTAPLPKPDWIRVKLPPAGKMEEIKKLLRDNSSVTVCEEASCPNLPECFGHGTATFMIMGDKCTRRCTFCDVAHGRPDPLDINEPEKLAKTVAKMKLKYIVITSVDRDDLRDGGAAHFAQCISETRKYNPNIKIEILVPDFRVDEWKKHWTNSLKHLQMFLITMLKPLRNFINKLDQDRIINGP